MASTLPSTAPFVDCQGLHKTFGQGPGAVVALRGVDLAVAKGQALGLMGPSGSGKSTLLHLIGGLEAPSAGSVTVAGRPVARLNDSQAAGYRCRHVGFVFQFANLIPLLNALDNIALPARLAGEKARSARARAQTLLAQVGLADKAAAYPDALSGGQQQRIALARALINDPPLLLADEPTGNLDRANGRRVLDLLAELVSNRDLTLIMATHSDQALDLFTQVLHLEDGRLQAPL
ncbi:MAG: ATP-binding cassette domain-containing protein [Candidatus Latescibacteria bacterium]|nr:ATP-binding cassette domain-containing protein [Candidatus Latescibacterota bacterium]